MSDFQAKSFYAKKVCILFVFTKNNLYICNIETKLSTNIDKNLTL